MKLAEALSRRSTVQKDLAWVRDQLNKIARAPEGSRPPEDPEEMLRRMEEDAAEYQQLLAAINRTNLSVRDSQGRTMTALLAERDTLRARQTILVDTYQAATSTEEHYSPRELRYLPTLDVVALRKRLETVNGSLRDINLKIQQLNWEADLET